MGFFSKNKEIFKIGNFYCISNWVIIRLFEIPETCGQGNGNETPKREEQGE
jgi:hypothetical protein